MRRRRTLLQRTSPHRRHLHTRQSCPTSRWAERAGFGGASTERLAAAARRSSLSRRTVELDGSVRDSLAVLAPAQPIRSLELVGALPHDEPDAGRLVVSLARRAARSLAHC